MSTLVRIEITDILSRAVFSAGAVYMVLKYGWVALVITFACVGAALVISACHISRERIGAQELAAREKGRR